MDTEIRIERVLPATIGKVYDAWTKLAEIFAAGADSTPENCANEPNFAAEVQVTFTPERENAVDPTVPTLRRESRRERRSRERALQNRQNKA